MTTVYLLEHVSDGDPDCHEPHLTLLGVFTSRALAESAFAGFQQINKDPYLSGPLVPDTTPRRDRPDRRFEITPVETDGIVA